MRQDRMLTVAAVIWLVIGFITVLSGHLIFGGVVMLLGFGILADSAVSRGAGASAPLLISRPSSSLAAFRSGGPSISRKELLRLGGVGAVFFFFLLKYQIHEDKKLNFILNFFS